MEKTSFRYRKKIPEWVIVLQKLFYIPHLFKQGTSHEIVKKARNELRVSEGSLTKYNLHPSFVMWMGIF